MRRFQYESCILTILDRLGASIFGYDLAVIASALIAPDFIRVTGLAQGSTYQGFIVSVMLLGRALFRISGNQDVLTRHRAFAGSLPAGLMADALSRRTSSETRTVHAAQVGLLTPTQSWLFP